MGSAEVGGGIAGSTDYLEEEKMRTNQVKEKLKRGEPVLGAWLSLPSVPSARIMARLGFDWLVADMEHSAQYPVPGSRSIGGAFGPYGFGITNWPDYARAANDETIVSVQIESAQALENLDEILSVPGIDVAFVGPNDLHAQLGLTPSTEGAEPEFVEALERVKVAARKHHIALGIFSGDGEAAAERISQGFQMISVTTDVSSMITSAVQNLRIAQGESFV